MQKSLLIVLLVAAFWSLQSCRSPEEVELAKSIENEVRVTESEQGFLFEEGDSPILFYQRAPKSFDGAYTRNNYLHPLWTLDGEVLTEDGPEDHLHQRGVFWAWHQTFVRGERLGDAWACQDFVWDVVQAEIEESASASKALVVEVLWKSPLWLDEGKEQKPVVKETTRIVVHPADSLYRAIDVEISLLALDDEVKIGGSEDEKGYGGFSARIEMPDNLSFRGPGGVIEPQTTQVEAGPWVNFEGSFGQNDKESGLAILVHPLNPGGINKWILRKKGSMQNPVFPGRELTLIPRDDPILLRYRLIVHGETAENLDLESLYSAHSN